MDSIDATPADPLREARLLSIAIKAVLGSGSTFSTFLSTPLLILSCVDDGFDCFALGLSPFLSTSCSLESIFDASTGEIAGARFLNIDARAVLGSGPCPSSSSMDSIDATPADPLREARLLGIAIKAVLGSSSTFLTFLSTPLLILSCVDDGFDCFALGLCPFLFSFGEKDFSFDVSAEAI